MDAALVSLARKGELDDEFARQEWPRDDSIPFDSSHRFMATLHHDHAGHAFAYVNGAPERLFAMCSLERHAGDTRPIHLDYWHRKQQDLGEQGQRVLAVAFRIAADHCRSLTFEPAERNVMQRPPRARDEPLLSALLVESILLVSVLMVIGTFGLFVCARQQGVSLELARTLAVNTLVAGEAFYLFNTRYLTASALNLAALTGNRYAQSSPPSSCCCSS